MITFWIISGILIACVLIVCVRQLFRTTNNPTSTDITDQVLYQQRLDEIDNDLVNGVLTEQEAENSRKEIELARQQYQQRSLPETTGTGSYKRVTALFLTMFVPVFVLLCYLYIGRPDLIDQQAIVANQEQSVTPEQIEKMVTQLEERLSNVPEDIDGWFMLYRSNMVLKRYDEAVNAAENLYQLQGDQVDILLMYVDALAMANNGQLVGKPQELIKRVLDIEPDNISAGWLAGMAENEAGDYQQALDYWQPLLPRLEQGSEPRQQLQLLIQMTQAQLDEPAGQQDEQQADIALTINVYVAPELADSIASDAILFVYARSQDDNSMPIAVIREQAGNFPTKVIMDESDTMLPSRKLSDFDSIQLIARISQNGQAKPENGDLIGVINNISPALKQPLDLIIRDQIQL